MGFTWIIMIVAMIAMFWFSSNSQKKKDKEAQDMRDSLQVGDEVTTIGGIIGKVVSIKEETFVLETTKEKTHIRFLKAAIRSVDVRIADVTGASIETKETPAQETAEEPKKKFGFFKKNK
ncbi:MAG: preprotein translocase subunit YajC [Clostridia bacterium]|nr:preprotein translocase subunit YajC [Clostridia bacterium]